MGWQRVTGKDGIFPQKNATKIDSGFFLRGMMIEVLVFGINIVVFRMRCCKVYHMYDIYVYIDISIYFSIYVRMISIVI